MHWQTPVSTLLVHVQDTGPAARRPQPAATPPSVYFWDSYGQNRSPPVQEVDEFPAEKARARQMTSGTFVSCLDEHQGADTSRSMRQTYLTSSAPPQHRSRKNGPGRSPHPDRHRPASAASAAAINPAAPPPVWGLSLNGRRGLRSGQHPRPAPAWGSLGA